MQTVNVIAALPPWAAALVWILAIAGFVVFVYRRVTGAGRPDPTTPTTPTTPDEYEAPSARVEAAATPSAFFVEPTPDRPGIPLSGAPLDEPAAAPAPPGEATGPDASVSAVDLVSATPTDAPADMPADPPADTGASSGPPAAPASSSRAGYFAPSGEAAAGSPAGSEARRLTVAEALRGVTMPCGLSPVIDGSVSIPNPFRVAFLTTTADAATVGASMGDELERLGYQLTTATVTEVLARKPGVELRVVLYPAPDKATRGLDQLFPVAPPGSVGIEFST